MIKLIADDKVSLFQN